MESTSYWKSRSFKIELTEVQVLHWQERVMILDPLSSLTDQLERP